MGELSTNLVITILDCRCTIALYDSVAPYQGTIVKESTFGAYNPYQKQFQLSVACNLHWWLQRHTSG